MTPVLSASCRCGKSVSTPCPTIADIPAAWADGFDSWGHDERGRVRCPTCLEAGDVPAATTAALVIDHGPLFGGGAG